MKNNEFWWASLCALLLVAINAGMNIWLRIAIALNAVVILINVFEKWRALRDGREDEAED